VTDLKRLRERSGIDTECTARFRAVSLGVTLSLSLAFPPRPAGFARTLEVVDLPTTAARWLVADPCPVVGHTWQGLTLALLGHLHQLEGVLRRVPDADEVRRLRLVRIAWLGVGHPRGRGMASAEMTLADRAA
jgi:hypothetical protein